MDWLDELWKRVEPLLPVRPAGRTGPKPLPYRQVLQGMLFVLFTGIGWEDLPQELGFGSGMTCWRRLRDLQAAGVFDRLHEVLLALLFARSVRICTQFDTGFRYWQEQAHLCDACRPAPHPIGRLGLFPPRQPQGECSLIPLR